MQTIEGPDVVGTRAGRIRPSESVGTRTTLSRPNPSRPRAFAMVACASSPTTTVIGGAENRPLASTSTGVLQDEMPGCREGCEISHCRPGYEFARAVARQTKEVNYPVECDILECNGSRRQTLRHGFWSQAPASQFAATVAGRELPVTNPK